jgi:hypothetical protein
LGLKDVGFVSNLEQFKRLTFAQIRLFIKTSKKMDELEKSNKRAKEGLKKKGPAISYR